MEKNRKYYIEKMNKASNIPVYSKIGTAIGMLSGVACITSGLLSKNPSLSQIGLGIIGVSGIATCISGDIAAEYSSESYDKLFDSEVSNKEKSLLSDIINGDVYRKRKAARILKESYQYSIPELAHRTNLSERLIADILYYNDGYEMRDVALEVVSEQEAMKHLSKEEVAKCNDLSAKIEKASMLTFSTKQSMEKALSELEHDKSMSRVKAEHMRSRIDVLTTIYIQYLDMEKALRDELERIIEIGRQKHASEVVTYNLTRKAFINTEYMEKVRGN